MKDSFGREINYARISVTDRCNLRCRYCMSEKGIEDKKSHADILPFEQMFKICNTLAELGVNKFRLTGGEPLVRRGVLDFLDRLSEINSIKRLCLTTNGTMLKEASKRLYSAGVRGLNVSLDTLKNDRYRAITRVGELEHVLQGIDAAYDVGFTDVKVNVVMMKGYNDDEINDFIEFGRKHQLTIRFIELMPFCVQQDFAKKHFFSAEDAIAGIDGLTHIGSEGNSVADYYETKDGMKVGFIKPISDKFCSRCNRVRITADGNMLDCLHSSKVYDLKPHIDKDLKDFIAGATYRKPACHELESGILQARAMDKIGG